jgi:hypothetical protein
MENDEEMDFNSGTITLDKDAAIVDGERAARALDEKFPE